MLRSAIEAEAAAILLATLVAAPVTAQHEGMDHRDAEKQAGWRMPPMAPDMPMMPGLNGAVPPVGAFLAAAGIAADELSVVIRTGGSSRLGAVIRLLEGRFPGRVVEHDPFTSIAAGLALASWGAAVG